MASVRLAFGVLLALLLAGTGRAADSADAAAELAAALQQAPVFSANFEQTVRAGDGVILQQASGVAQARRPGYLRWQIEQPDYQLIIADTQQILRYEADLMQLTIEPYSAELSAMPALLLSGEVGELQRHYRIERTQAGAFVLYPRDQSSLFQALEVQLQQGHVSRLRLVDGFDQTTDIVFTQVDQHTAIADTAFTFEPPPGVDILHND